MMARRTARLLGLLAVLSLTSGQELSSQGLSIGGYQLVSQQQQKNSVLFTYRATLTNGSVPLSSATATAKSMVGSIKLVDNALTFGRVGAGATLVSTDTFSFTHNGNGA